MKRLLSLLLSACLLAGCISVNITLPSASTATPAPSSTPTAYTLPTLETPPAYGPTPTPYIPEGGATPTATAYIPEGGPGATPTPTAYVSQDGPVVNLTSVPPPASPPRALYFLAKSAVWALRPNAEKAVRLTAEDSVVTAFDVWPEDGRIAYGTRSGKLYLIMPGNDARLLLKLPDDGPYPAYINGLDWSPDGTRVAYTVSFDGGGQSIQAAYPSSPSGLWVVAIKEAKPVWMLSNRYPSGAAGDDINKYRSLSNPQWSPDGQSVLLRGRFWEWTDMLWLYPLLPSFDDAYLHAFVPDPARPSTWDFASWTPDGLALVFAGQGNVTLGGLGYAKRDGTKAEIWWTGEGTNLYIHSGVLVPTGSYVPASSLYLNAGPGRVLYLATCPECRSNPGPRMFIQMNPYAEYNQNGEIIGPEKLCVGKDQNGNANWPRAVEWQPNFSQGVLACGSNEIYLLDMLRAAPEETDLLSKLPPLDPGEVPIFRWGEL